MEENEVEVVDSREAEVDLMEKVVDLIVLCKIRTNLHRIMLIKERLSRKVLIPTEEVLVLTEEEVILILEVVFMVIVLDVVKKDIDLLNVDLLEVGRINRNIVIQEDIESSLSEPEAR